MNTPWGQSQSIDVLAHGIKHVTTAGHGGYWVPKAALSRIPAAHRAYAAKWSGSEQWYEEDCAWACVALAFPDCFPSDNTPAIAREVVARYIPEAP